MRSNSNSVKIFQLDVLSLVLACIISLLFTKGVVEFLSNTSKKKEHQCASAPHARWSDYNEEKLFLSVDHHPQSPIENHTISASNWVIPLQQFKTIRSNVLIGAEIESHIFKSTDWYLEQSYKNTLPARWGPTLSIAHCRLII